MIHEPRPFDAEAYEMRLGYYGCLATKDPARNVRIVRVTLRRSWLFRLWRRLRRYFAGPT